MRPLLVPLLALVLPLAGAAAEPGAPLTDLAGVTCRQVVADAAAVPALAVWLDGWRQGRANETGYDPDAIAAGGGAWHGACAAAPQRPLLEVAADNGTPPHPGPAWTDIAFLKCFQFIELAEEDRERAVAIVRWIDGWHAGSLGDTRFGAQDHERMAEAAMDACAERSYHKRNLIRVLAGRHR